MREYQYSHEIHQRVYDIRKALKLTQKEMARKMGFSESVVSKLEARETDPIKEYVILAICNTFHVNFDYLVYGKGHMFDELTAEHESLLGMYEALPDECKQHVLRYLKFLTTEKE